MASKTGSTKQKKPGLCPFRTENANSTGKMRMCPISYFLFNTVLEVQQREKKEKKGNKVEKKLYSNYPLTHIILRKKVSQMKN